MPARTFILLLGILAGICPAEAGENQSAGLGFSEQLVLLGGPRPGWSLLRSSVTTSPDSAHVGFKTSQDGYLTDWAMVCDDQFRAMPVSPGRPVFTPDSAGIAYFFKEGPGWYLRIGRGPYLPAFEPVSALVFSADGSRMAYLARTQRKNKRFVVDGSEPHTPFDAVDLDSLAFNNVGDVLAYRARIGQRWLMVVNGEVDRRWDHVPQRALLAPTGSRVAYLALKAGLWHVVVDGEPGPGFRRIDEQQLAFSGDGQHLAYWAQDSSGSWQLILNGQAHPAYRAQKPGQIVFNHDGSLLGAAMQRHGKWLVSRNGQPGRPFDAVAASSLTVSPDGQHLAYAAMANSRWQVIRDGQVQRQFAQLLEGLHFSPDSSRLIYAGCEAGQWYLVEDNQRYGGHTAISADSIQFSPDSKRFAYVARNAARFQAMVDGQPLGTQASGIKHLRFSPDSARALWVAEDGPRTSIVVDGVVSSLEFDQLAPGARLEFGFANPNTAHTVVMTRPGPVFHRVELNLANHAMAEAPTP